MIGWENFFSAQVGASAALLGLIFVGVSINLARIISLPGLLNRALLALIILLTILVVSSLLLVPGQSLTLVGIELLVVGLFVWIIATRLDVIILLKKDPQYRKPYVLNMVLNSVRNIALCYRWNHCVNARRWWSVLDSSRNCDLIYQGYPGCMGFAGRDHPLAIIEDNVNSGAGYVVLPFLIQPPHKRSYTSTSMPFDSVQGQMLSSPKK